MEGHLTVILFVEPVRVTKSIAQKVVNLLPVTPVAFMVT
jgi:hypothetical protein